MPRRNNSRVRIARDPPQEIEASSDKLATPYGFIATPLVNGRHAHVLVLADARFDVRIPPDDYRVECKDETIAEAMNRADNVLMAFSCCPARKPVLSVPYARMLTRLAYMCEYGEESTFMFPDDVAQVALIKLPTHWLTKFVDLYVTHDVRDKRVEVACLLKEHAPIVCLEMEEMARFQEEPTIATVRKFHSWHNPPHDYGILECEGDFDPLDPPTNIRFVWPDLLQHDREAMCATKHVAVIFGRPGEKAVILLHTGKRTLADDLAPKTMDLIKKWGVEGKAHVQSVTFYDMPWDLVFGEGFEWVTAEEDEGFFVVKPHPVILLYSNSYEGDFAFNKPTSV